MAVKVKYNDDLFKDTTMTFGEHLEELRRSLFLALIGLVAGTIFGLFVGKPIVLGIQAPLKAALETYYKDISKERARAWVDEQIKKGVQIPHNAAYYEGLVDQGMIFDPVYFESDEVFAALRQSYPGALGTFTLPGNPPGHVLSKNGPTTVTAEELGDGRALAQALVAAGKSTEPTPPRRVWELLPADAQARIERAAASRELSDEDGRAQAAEVAAALDGLLASPTLASDPAFAEVTLVDEAVGIKKIAAPTDLERRRLNRLLLEAVFPGELQATHPDLVRLLIWRPVEESPDTRIKSLSAAEVFGFYIKASLLVGAVLSSPWVFYHLWTFVAAGLYPHEKRYVYIYLPFSIGLFLLGAAVVFLFVFEPVLNFLFGFNKWLGIDPDPRISEWLGLALLLPVGFGVSFQLPLVMLFLQRIGVFNTEMYITKWRIAILAIFVIAMVLTPSDPYSMLLMAVPLTILYFGGIGLCKWMPRNRSPFDD
jgi:sec-independent protein translocase protein TatC